MEVHLMSTDMLLKNQNKETPFSLEVSLIDSHLTNHTVQIKMDFHCFDSSTALCKNWAHGMNCANQVLLGVTINRGH